MVDFKILMFYKQIPYPLCGLPQGLFFSGKMTYILKKVHGLCVFYRFLWNVVYIFCISRGGVAHPHEFILMSLSYIGIYTHITGVPAPGGLWYTPLLHGGCPALAPSLEGLENPQGGARPRQTSQKLNKVALCAPR